MEKLYKNSTIYLILTDEARSSEVNILARPKSPAQVQILETHLKYRMLDTVVKQTHGK